MERLRTTILLIEDDEDDYILLQKILATVLEVEYTIQWERSYNAGLTYLLKGTHDICMLDYRLGAQNGIELTIQARTLGYRGPIILLTGANGGQIDIQALQAGADDYIAKEQLQGQLLYRIIRYAIERKKTEHERERLLSEQIATKELERRRNEFISMVVHELKTPLTSLKGYAHLLRRRFTRAEDAQSTHLASRMETQIDKLTGLIDDFLDVTRLAGGTLQFHEEYFAFDDLVNEIVDDLQVTNEQVAIQRKGLTQAQVWGDRMRIGQVITNFLTNAIKYGDGPENILVKTQGDEKSVTLCVQDSGPGIPKALHEKIFDPFYRIEQNSEQGIKPGLGLGLHIASEIIKRQGGRIWVESEEGQGATFCFTLPHDQSAGQRESEPEG